MLEYVRKCMCVSVTVLCSDGWRLYLRVCCWVWISANVAQDEASPQRDDKARCARWVCWWHRCLIALSFFSEIRHYFVEFLLICFVDCMLSWFSCHLVMLYYMSVCVCVRPGPWCVLWWSIQSVLAGWVTRLRGRHTVQSQTTGRRQTWQRFFLSDVCLRFCVLTWS